MQEQKFFWECTTRDGEVRSELNPDGTLNNFGELTEEFKSRVRFIELFTTEYQTLTYRTYYEFDLATGKLDQNHLFNGLSLNKLDMLENLGVLPIDTTKEPIKFHQYKRGHTDVNLSNLASSPNVIDEHVIGYKFSKKIGFLDYVIEVNLRINPYTYSEKPQLVEVTLKEEEPQKKFQAKFPEKEVGVFSIYV